MEPAAIGSESFLLRCDSFKLAESQPEARVRIKTVSKMFPGPFYPCQRVQRKHNLLVRGQPSVVKAEEKHRDNVVLPSLYSIMHQIVKDKSCGVLQDEKKSPKEDVQMPDLPTKGDLSHSKDLLLRGNSLEFDNKRSKPVPHHKYSMSHPTQASMLRLRRESSKHLKVHKRPMNIPIVPEITLTVIDSNAGTVEPQRPSKTPSHLKTPLPEIRRGKQHLTFCNLSPDASPTSFLRSPCFSQASSQSSIRSSNCSERDSGSEEQFDDTLTISKAGVWQPWSTHLTPFHDLMEMHPQRQSKVHRYLRRLKPVANEPQLDCSALHIGVKAARTEGVKCTCPHPLHLRNLRKFCVQGIQSLHFTLYQKKLCKLQQLIKPADPPMPVLLVHVEGVVMDFQKANLFDHSPIAFTLRPGAVDGLRQLSKHFSLVFLSSSPVPRFYKVLEFLIQHRVQLSAAYCVQSVPSEDSEPQAACFLDYTQICADFGLKDRCSQKVLLLGALRAEVDSRSESALFSASGVKVRLNARHLPVVMQTRVLPIITVLVPHLRVEGNECLRFTVISHEIQRIFRAVTIYNLDEAFHLRSVGDSSLIATYIKTQRVHEAYYSFLLPLLRSEDLETREEEAEMGRWTKCSAHPLAQQVARLIPENRIVLLSSPRASDLARCDTIDLDPLDPKIKHLNLLSYATAKDE